MRTPVSRSPIAEPGVAERDVAESDAEAAADEAAALAEVYELVRRSQAGDGHAFAQIYDRYGQFIHLYVYRRVRDTQAAEDLTADVFLKAYRRIGAFEWRGKDLGAWLVTIARNRVHDHFRSAAFQRSYATDAIEQTDTSQMTQPEDVAVARDAALAVGRAIEQLSDSHREIIELRFIHGMGVSECAEAMGRTVGATKALQHRALRSLTDLLDRETPVTRSNSTTVLAAALGVLKTMGGA